MPATAGPSSRAALKTDELMAMALPRSSWRSTISITNDCRAVRIEGADHSQQGAQDEDLPDADHARHRQGHQGEGLDHHQGLRGEHRAMAVPAIGEHAGQRQNQGGGDLRGEIGHAQQQRRIGSSGRRARPWQSAASRCRARRSPGRRRRGGNCDAPAPGPWPGAVRHSCSDHPRLPTPSCCRPSRHPGCD